MKTKLTSRKFWVAVGSILAILICDIVGVELDKETVIAVVISVASYILGEGMVDTARARNQG